MTARCFRAMPVPALAGVLLAGAVILLAIGASAVLPSGASAQEATPAPGVTPPAATASPPAATAAPPAALRAIPGITAPDSFPRACVDCHVNLPEHKMDARLSTLLAQWSKSVEPGLLEKAEGAAPPGVTLKGRHPKLGALGSIPARCMKCHAAASKTAPPFRKLIHRIHLVGGEKNDYLTEFGGQCTYCHKLNEATGEWSIPSAPEP